MNLIIELHQNFGMVLLILDECAYVWMNEFFSSTTYKFHADLGS